MSVSAIENDALRGIQRKQLISLAREIRLPRYSRMSKEQLRAALALAASTRKTELPAIYGTTRLTLMAIEPSRIHVYWDITPPDRKRALDATKTEGVPVPWALRFYDTMDLASDATPTAVCDEVPVDLESGNWYVNLPARITSCFAEIGLSAAGCRFSPVCRSNSIEIPSGVPAPPQESQWLKVEGPSFSPIKVENAEPVPAAHRFPSHTAASLLPSSSMPPGSMAGSSRIRSTDL